MWSKICAPGSTRTAARKDRLTGKNPENPAAVKPEQSDNTVTMSVNRWAAETLPTIERNLDHAKQINDDLDRANNRPSRGNSGTSDTKAKGASKY